MSSYKEIEEEVLNLIRESPPEDIKDSLITFRDALADCVTNSQTPQEGFLLPGWMNFNRLMGGGLMERQFTILCGPTGAGKTTILANIACQLVSNLIPVFVASVEVGSDSFMRKIISIVSGGTSSHQEKISPEVVLSLGKAFNTTGSVFTNYDSRVPHLQLLCDLLYANRVHGAKVALIDNLNFLMAVTDQKNAIVAMDNAVHDFVVFTKKVPMHIIMVMHPRKTDGGRIESEFDIKGSSTAVQEASNVILFNRLRESTDAPLGCDPELCRELKFAKIRNQGRSVGAKLIFKIDPESELYAEKRLF